MRPDRKGRSALGVHMLDYNVMVYRYQLSLDLKITDSLAVGIDSASGVATLKKAEFYKSF
jgi:hypothetical protein